MRVLIRPEQVTLSPTAPAADAPTLGQGEVVEQTFAGATRRMRVRLPPLPGVRQVVPPLPFGEENLLLEVAVPAHAPPPPPRPWVVLDEWHILRQPTPRLLVCDEGTGLAPALELAAHLVEALDGVATVLGVARGPAQGRRAARGADGPRGAGRPRGSDRARAARRTRPSRSRPSSARTPTTS